MNNFLGWLFYLFLMIACLVIGMYIAYMIGESDLSFWVKYWLLK